MVQRAELKSGSGFGRLIDLPKSLSAFHKVDGETVGQEGAYRHADVESFLGLKGERVT